jgi:C_GCAxxG_C_C family probable redox protein
LSVRAEAAVALFADGCSCAQSLLAVYGPGLGLDRETALRVASPFAGGLSRTDGLCGAAAGGLLVLGLRHGTVDPGDEAGKERVRRLCQDFLGRYRERFGSTGCTALIGLDLSEPGEPERAKAEGRGERICSGLVRGAAELLEELL